MNIETRKETNLLMMLIEKNQIIEAMVTEISDLRKQIATLEGKDDDGEKFKDAKV